MKRIIKKRNVLNFSPESSERPIIYTLVKEYNIKVNILKGQLLSGKTGYLLLDMEATVEEMKKAVLFLKQNKVSIQSIDKKIQFNEIECIHCGACTAVCFAGALEMIDAELVFIPEKCVACGLCVKACPLKLFQLSIETE
jgi:ferredoxin